MKTVEQFVFEKLTLMTDQFCEIQLSCHRDSFDGTFCVQLKPSFLLEDGGQVENFTIRILDEVLHFYPGESIVFFTENSTVSMDRPDYVLTGEKFAYSKILATAT